MRTIVDTILAPFMLLPPVAALVVISIIFGVALVPVYGKISSQARIRRVKRDIHAAVLECVLFRKQLAVCLRAQVRMFWGGMRYFGLAVPPILILAIPCVLLLAQLNLYFGSRGFTPGEHAVVSAQLNKGVALRNVALTTDSSALITPPVRVQEPAEVTWRIDSANDGVVGLRLTIDGAEVVQKNLIVGESRAALAPIVSADFWESLLYPGDVSLPPSITRLTVSYPERSLPFLGLETNWIIIFLVVSILSGLFASRFFGIEV